MAEGITQSAIIVPSCPEMRNWQYWHDRPSRFSKTSPWKLHLMSEYCTEHSSRPGLEICLAYKVPAAPQTWSQWILARSESRPRVSLPIKCLQLCRGWLLSPARVRGIISRGSEPGPGGLWWSLMMRTVSGDVGVDVILAPVTDQSYLNSIRVLMRGW